MCGFVLFLHAKYSFLFYIQEVLIPIVIQGALVSLLIFLVGKWHKKSLSVQKGVKNFIDIITIKNLIP